MSVSAAAIVDYGLTESVANGQAEYQYTETYMVIASAASVGPIAVLGAAGLPPPYSSKVVPSTGSTVWVVSRTPRRSGTGADRLKWYVDCQYTNLTGRFERDTQGNPTDDLENTAPTIDFHFQETWEPVTEAKFKGAIETTSGTEVQIPDGFTVDATYCGIYNSACDRIERERRGVEKTVHLRKFFRQWNAEWGKKINHINDDVITLRQQDSTGTILSETYQKWQLLLLNVSKTDVWRKGMLYLSVVFELGVREQTWIHTEPDAGTRWRAFSGQYHPRDNTALTGSNLSTTGEAGKFVTNGLHPIQTYDEDGEVTGAVGDPVPLNGYGQAIPLKRPGFTSGTSGKSFALQYWTHKQTSFSALGITT